MTNLENKLNTLKTLEKDWDDYGANPPKADLLLLVERVLGVLKGKGIRDPDDLYALSEDEVFIEWFNDDPEKTAYRLILDLKDCHLWVTSQPLNKKRPTSDFFDLKGEPESWNFSSIK